MKNNWIAIWDNTKEARLIYVSESITDHLGWEPQDIIGREGYDLFHPGDHNSLRKVHLANVYNEKMSSMVSYRIMAKDGSYVRIETILHYCHDALIGSNFLYDEESLDHKIRANSVDEVYVCLPDGNLQLVGAWNDRQERLQDALDMETMLKNNQLILRGIEYPTELVSLDTVKAIGTPLYDYISEKDAPLLKYQVDLAKQHDMVMRLRFDWLMDRERGLSEPVEAIASCTDDGIVMVFRLSPRLFMDDDTT
ncbi:hypothetical protein PS6_001091 [Mucor atramentarius]